MYISYVTLSIKIWREHACKTEIHSDNDDENKQKEDDGEEILG